MANPWDTYAKGRLIADVGALTSDRTVIFPDADVDLSLVGTGITLDQLLPVNEGFESATFPPPSIWLTPSPAWGGDLAWQRTTSSPILGAASAIRNISQTHNQGSSIRLVLNLLAPARLSWRWRVLSEEFFDQLWTYVDGVQVFRAASATQLNGRFVTDVLAPGVHVIDWRFTKDGSGTAAGETAMLDDVRLMPTGQFLDPESWLFERDDFVGVPGNRWQTGAGSTGSAAVINGAGGLYRLTSGAAASAYWAIDLGQGQGFLSFAKEPVIDLRLALNSTSNAFLEAGLNDGTNSNKVMVRYQSSVSPNWYLVTVSGGVTTALNTGVAAVAGAMTRFRLAFTSSNVSLMINGVANQTASGQRFASNTNLPTGSNLKPQIVVQTTDAVAKSCDVDYFQLQALR